MNNKWMTIFFGLLIVGLIANLFDKDIEPTTLPVKPKLNMELVKFNDEGYFKDKNRNRIWTISYEITKNDINNSAIMEHVKKNFSGKMSSGFLTTAYYYPYDSRMPRDGVTRAHTTYQALKSIDTMMGYDFACIRNEYQSIICISCKEMPTNNMCQRSLSTEM